MAFCQKCGSELENGALFCASCGTQAEVQAVVPTEPEAPTASSGVLNTGMLVFSIINTFLCTMLGLIAAIVTIHAKDSRTAEEEQRMLKIAKVLNIISVAGFAAIFVFYIIFYIFAILLMSGATPV
ncbi:MAG: zinc-ribbon domain-containing protein [Clostridia bacterium]|nr:zinc-ribbon domain-containing protein [Clostridia bacterium]